MSTVAQPTMHYQVDGSLILTLAQHCFSREAVMATAYWFVDRGVVTCDAPDETRWVIHFSPASALDHHALQGIADEFYARLLDQQVRCDLDARTGRLREIILEQAFAPAATTVKKKTSR